jgi:hypothetical protein
MRWGKGQRSHMGEIKNSYIIYIGRSNERYHLEELVGVLNIISKLILK